MESTLHQNKKKPEGRESKRREKLSADVLLLQNNAPVYAAWLAEGEEANCSFELLLHSLYSQGLTPSDFLFVKLRSHLRSRYFINNKEVICAVEEIWEKQDTFFFRNEI